MAEDLDLIDILQLALRGEREDIHTSLPGKIVKYYPDTQTADVQLMIKRSVFDTDDKRQDPVSLPMLPKVPVIWPRAGGYIITMPLGKNDFVWVMFSEAGTGEYRETGQESEAFDVSRHQLTYPVCMPGAAPDVKASIDSDVVGNSEVVIGAESGEAKVKLRQYRHYGDAATRVTIGTGDTSIVCTEKNPDDIITKAKIVIGGGTDKVALATKIDSLINLLLFAYVPAGTETGFASLLADLASWKGSNWGPTDATTASKLITSK